MRRHFNQPVICPVLIGRKLDCDALFRFIEHTRSGDGQIVALSGEAGIGKSRLITETSARAAQATMLVLQGNCFEGDHALPYAPLLDMLRAYCITHDSEEVVRSLGPTAPELVKLLPDLTSIVPGLIPTAILEPEQEKRRLFQTLMQLFSRLVTVQPLLVIVEDLHWSDETSLEFLLQLARWGVSYPMLLVVTYRSDEIQAVLRHFLAALDRERLATEIVLPRFTRDEVDAMLRAMFDLRRSVRGEFLDAIYTLSDGNPYFIEEILKVLIATGDIFYVDGSWDRKPMAELQIPRSVQDAVQRRVDRLDEVARNVLMLAAVAGQRFDFTLLQAVTQLDESALLHAMRALITAQLVVEESEDQFAFRHALTRQAVYTQLLARERRTLHQRIGEALEQIYADTRDSHLADLTYHFYEARVWTKVLDYAPRAADKAQVLYAPGSTVEHLTRALDAAQHLAMPPSAHLYRARGLAYEILGEFEKTRADHEMALSIAQTARDQQAEWRALHDLGALWAGRDYSQTGLYYQRAVQVARAIADPSTIAHSLNRLGNWYANVEQSPAGQQYHLEALTIFESSDNRRGLAQTYDLMGMAYFIPGDAVQAATYFEQATALFRELGDREGLCSSTASRMVRGDSYQTMTIVAGTASLEELVRDGELAIKLAQEIGWRAGESYPRRLLGSCLACHGEFTRALTLTRSAMAIAEEIEHRQWLAGAFWLLGCIYLDLLDPLLAQQHFERALAFANQTGSSLWMRFAGGHLAMSYTAQGHLAQAESVLDTMLEPNTPVYGVSFRLCWCAKAEIAVAQGKPGTALEIVDRLIGNAPQAQTGGVAVIPYLWKLRGEALIVLNRMAEAEAALQAAQTSAESRGLLPRLWQIQIALGQLYHKQGNREAAENAFFKARKSIDLLASNLEDESLRDTFLRQSNALIPRAFVLSPRRTAQKEFDGLTARECEVAAQIAQGLSNREIGDVLVVNERTIEKHISNILSKLSFTSRRQIAVWAKEKGLIPGTKRS